jgi:hypothetical protein
MKTFKIVNNDISDGYHTFGELYDHRCALYVLLCLRSPEQCTWRPDFEDWFVLYMDSPLGQISYHVPNKMLCFIENKIKRDDNHVWDGHSSATVLQRLTALASEESPS